MTMFYSWRSQADQEAEAKMRELLKTQREIEAEILIATRNLYFDRVYLRARYHNFADYYQHTFDIKKSIAKKRTQFAAILGGYPKLLELLRERKITATHITDLASHITQANSDKIIAFLPNSTTRELRRFLKSINSHGHHVPQVRLPNLGSEECPVEPSNWYTSVENQQN